MTSPAPITLPDQGISNSYRKTLVSVEARSQRTFTPTQAVLARSAGCWHWTPEGKPLLDATSGVLVANLGHNPTRWMKRYFDYMGWSQSFPTDTQFISAITMTAYNGVTPVEMEASQRLIHFCQQRKGGQRLQRLLWAASGSEAIHKAIHICLNVRKDRPYILASRFGFHGKKGHSNSVTGSETDPERDPRVLFFPFPMHDCEDISLRQSKLNLGHYLGELEKLWQQSGEKIGSLVTEPYLGGGGSYHPQLEYLQAVEQFCRERDILFLLDEVQANFGRTGEMFAYEKYGLEPDIVILGKGLGNGVPVAALLGRADLFDHLNYGEASDTWSANPLSSAAVLATLDTFDEVDVLGPMRQRSSELETGLMKLKDSPIVKHVRGEEKGMVWGIEFQDFGGETSAHWANAFVYAAHIGDGGQSPGVHLLGPLAKKVVRISPPLVISQEEVAQLNAILFHAAASCCRI